MILTTKLADNSNLARNIKRHIPIIIAIKAYGRFVVKFYCKHYRAKYVEQYLQHRP